MDKINELKKLAATLNFLGLKVQGMHFIVKGSHFRAAHRALKKYYRNINEFYDTINERLVALNAEPITRLSEVTENKLSSFPEFSGTSDIEQIWIELLRDFNTLNDYIDSIIELTIDDKDYVTEDILRDEKFWLEKQIWKVKSSID